MDLTLSHEFLERTKPFLQASSERAIQQHDLFLVDSTATSNKLKSFHASVLDSRDFPICGPMLKAVSKACKDVQASTFAILFHPIIDHLVSVNSPQMIEDIWRYV